MTRDTLDKLAAALGSSAANDLAQTTDQVVVATLQQADILGLTTPPAFPFLPAASFPRIPIWCAADLVPGTQPLAPRGSNNLFIGGNGVFAGNLNGAVPGRMQSIFAFPGSQTINGLAEFPIGSSAPNVGAGSILTQAVNAGGTGYANGDTGLVAFINGSVSAVSQANRTITFGVGAFLTTLGATRLAIAGSTGNDGLYTIVSQSFSGVGTTTVTVAQALPSAVADGTGFFGSSRYTVATNLAGVVLTVTITPLDGGGGYIAGETGLSTAVVTGTGDGALTLDTPTITTIASAAVLHVLMGFYSGRAMV